MTYRTRTIVAAGIACSITLAACSSGSTAAAGSSSTPPASGAPSSSATAGSSASGAPTTTSGSASSSATASNGPHGVIKVWYAVNPAETAWAKSAIADWNAAHPSETVSGDPIPQGNSTEDVVTASIAGGTTPCVILNGSAVAVPGYVKQGGVVDLDKFSDGKSYIETRSGTVATQYQTNGKYYQMPWKDNPEMIFYNKDIFKKAGLDPENPALSTYAGFLQAAKAVTAKGGAQFAIWPAPTSEWYQSLYDFQALYMAQSGGKQVITNGKATFADSDGVTVATFLRSLYDSGLASREKYSADAFADGKSAMAIVGPWAIAVYKGKVNWGAVPLPTQNGKAADQTYTFTDSKTLSMYANCVNQGTAWDFMKFITSKDGDGKFLNMTGELPMRTNLASTYADYVTKNPSYKLFIDQAAHVAEVPSVPNGVAVWQAIRDGYSQSVIFGKEPVNTALTDAASKVDSLISGQ